MTDHTTQPALSRAQPAIERSEGPVERDPQPGPVHPRRHDRIDRANARSHALRQQRLGYFRAHGYPPHEIARLTGLPIQAVLAHDP